MGMQAGCPGGDHFCCFWNILGRAEKSSVKRSTGQSSELSLE